MNRSKFGNPKRPKLPRKSGLVAVSMGNSCEKASSVTQDGFGKDRIMERKVVGRRPSPPSSSTKGFSKTSFMPTTIEILPCNGTVSKSQKNSEMKSRKMDSRKLNREVPESKNDEKEKEDSPENDLEEDEVHGCLSLFDEYEKNSFIALEREWKGSDIDSLVMQRFQTPRVMCLRVKSKRRDPRLGRSIGYECGSPYAKCPDRFVPKHIRYKEDNMAHVFPTQTVENARMWFVGKDGDYKGRSRLKPDPSPDDISKLVELIKEYRVWKYGEAGKGMGDDAEAENWKRERLSWIVNNLGMKITGCWVTSIV